MNRNRRPPNRDMARPTPWANFMNAFSRPKDGGPPGIEYLASVDFLFVRQKVELLEVFTGIETKNKYMVTNSSGENMYFIIEESSCLMRTLCSRQRPFEMRVFDMYRNEVINIKRPLAFSLCGLPCIPESITVSSPPGRVVGRVKQNFTFLIPSFSVQNEFGQTVLYIKGPLFTTSCCGNDVKFRVMSVDGSTQIGEIAKKWTGCTREWFTDADNFGIAFPLDLDVKMKATLLGACMLIDMMFFER